MNLCRKYELTVKRGPFAVLQMFYNIAIKPKNEFTTLRLHNLFYNIDARAKLQHQDFFVECKIVRVRTIEIYNIYIERVLKMQIRLDLYMPESACKQLSIRKATNWITNKGACVIKKIIPYYGHMTVIQRNHYSQNICFLFSPQLFI